MSINRNGSSQYRSGPHSLTYNPAENSVLICSVSLGLRVRHIMHVHLLPPPPLSLFLSLSLSFSLQNTNNVETAYYELYTIPRDVDPSNPECKLAKHIHVHVHVCIVRFSLFHHLVLLFHFCFYYPPSDLTLTSL